MDFTKKQLKQIAKEVLEVNGQKAKNFDNVYCSGFYTDDDKKYQMEICAEKDNDTTVFHANAYKWTNDSRKKLYVTLY